MITVNEQKFDNGKKLYKILDDAQLAESPVYAKIFPDLYAEVKAQYGSAESHWYSLSDTAHRQYMQHQNGLVDYS